MQLEEEQKEIIRAFIASVIMSLAGTAKKYPSEKEKVELLVMVTTMVTTFVLLTIALKKEDVLEEELIELQKTTEQFMMNEGFLTVANIFDDSFKRAHCKENITSDILNNLDVSKMVKH